MSYISQCLADGALSLWPLSEPVGSTTAVDIVNASGNGTYNGGPTLGRSGVPGIGLPATQFVAASSTYMQAPVHAGNVIADTFTYEIWATWDAVTVVQGLICANIAQRQYLRLALTNNGVLNILSADSVNMGFSRGVFLGGGVFNHCVWTKQGSTSKMFINSIDLTPASITNVTFGSTSGGSYSIGRDFSAADFSNSINSCAAIYGTALSPDTIRLHWQLGALPGVSVSSHPVGRANR